jgi:serine/threonine protein kinase/tetratricopeptide (TPR) repeat protein
VDELVAGRYQLVRTLGRGGMGEVLLARQLNLDRLVVVKRVTDIKSKRSLRALVDEAKIAARLNHPNIVAVLDVIDTAEQPLVVLEFVAGVSLRELIEESPAGLPLEIALPIAIDLLRGLGYAHGVRSGDAVGVIHRDVKPRNVMVTFAGVTKLIDFGISRWLGDDGAWDATSVSGTRGYMAPEQQRGQRVDGRADIYAVGVTLREMLTGAPPIDDTGNAGATPREIAEPYLRTIVERACADGPEDRFADCAAMLAALEGFATAASVAVSVTQVERWTSARFADRKAFLEHDAEHRRPKPPTNPTIVDGHRARGSAPVRIGPRINVVAHVANGESWVAPVIERMLHREILHADDRRFHLASGDRTAQQIDLVAHHDGGELKIDATCDGIVVGSATATSIHEATRSIARALTELAPPEPSLPADPDEEREMRRLDVTSVGVYRRYRRAIDVLLSSSFADSRSLTVDVETAIAEDPQWPRAYALLVMLYGVHTPDAISTLAGARATLSGDRDRTGMRLLEALDLLRSDQHEASFAILGELFQTDAHDPLVGTLLMRLALVLQELDDAGAVARKCHQEHPDLWFGFDLAECFYRTGHAREAERVIRECVAMRPENVPTTVELIRIEAAAMNMAEASRHAEHLMAIHGERRHLLTELFEAMVASGQLPRARRLAEQMVLGSPLERARGRYRMAVIAVLEGKFSSAHNSLRKAIHANRSFGYESELTQCLELGRVIAHVVGDVAAQRAMTRELAEVFTTIVGDPACDAILRHELAILEHGQANIEEHLAPLDGGPRDLARMRMLRMAALGDPSLARAVVDAGFTSNEDNTASLLALGICARGVGELALARKSFEIACRLWSSTMTNQPSPYHAVLAQYHLARTLAELGEIALARAHYEAFLKSWGDADRPIAEVALARKALAEL